jgi:hypothetical protein
LREGSCWEGQGLRRHLLARRAQAAGKLPGRRAALGHFVRICRAAEPARHCRCIPRRRAAAVGMRCRAGSGRQHLLRHGAAAADQAGNGGQPWGQSSPTNCSIRLPSGSLPSTARGGRPASRKSRKSRSRTLLFRDSIFYGKTFERDKTLLLRGHRLKSYVMIGGRAEFYTSTEPPPNKSNPRGIRSKTAPRVFKSKRVPAQSVAASIQTVPVPQMTSARPSCSSQSSRDRVSQTSYLAQGSKYRFQGSPQLRHAQAGV